MLNSVLGRGSALVTTYFSGESAVKLKQNIGLSSVIVKQVSLYRKLHVSYFINSHYKIQVLSLEISFVLHVPYFMPFTSSVCDPL
jgi:hypothetical protein